ncbi:MAG: S9 family peptidase [Myxococcales bacterium]|nr:S9 family peptidase [Myxococcales bacterium]
MQRVAFGAFPSPLSPEAVAGAGLRLSFPSFSAGGARFWVEGRPELGGKGVLVCEEPSGARRDRTPGWLDVRTKVHEYGGRPYALARSGRIVVSDGTDGRLHLVEPDGPVHALTTESPRRFAEMVFDEPRGRILAVSELHDGGTQPVNELVAIDLETGAVRALLSGHDFYASPTLSPDGRRLAFLTWDHPHMPWDAAVAWVATLDGEGRAVEPRRVAGGEGGAAYQPTFGPDGALYVSVEVDDRFRLHRVTDQGLVRVLATEADVFQPLWLLGTECFGFAGRRVVAAGLEAGLSVLLVGDLDTGSVTVLDDGLGHVGQVAVSEHGALAIRGWAGRDSSLVHYDLETRSKTVLRQPPPILDEDDHSAPVPVRFATTHGETAHGFFYAPRLRGFEGPGGERPPLLVTVHGGPTGCAAPTPNLAIQLWTTRGFAVLDVNYRGSTGFGRRYRERLRGQWGVLDVDDCVEGARAMGEEGRVDPARLAIRGGSAGGYTVLRALSLSTVFRSGACHFGISDLEALTRDTHKFESHYDRFLVGPYPERKDLFVERSPIHAPEKLTAPVVFFQGLEDKAVPPAQTRAIYDAMRARGIDAEYHAFEGEGHGFRRPENVRHAIEAEVAFHRRVLRLG